MAASWNTVPMNGPAHMFIFVPVYRYGIAVIGRTEFQLCLASQEAMLASKLAFVSAKGAAFGPLLCYSGWVCAQGRR